MATPVKTKKKNHLAWILSCLGIFVLVASLMTNLVLGMLLASYGLEKTAGYTPKFTEKCLEGDCSDSNSKIAVININGPIFFSDSTTSLFSPTSPTAETIGQQIDQATEDPTIAAIVLNINSPGGSVTASDYLYNKVTEAQNAGLVITTYFKDTGASGAYYLAAPSDIIMANPTALTGSIGVIISTLNYEGLYDKLGLKSVVYKSGNKKDILSATRAQTEDEQKILQSIVDESKERFINIVKENRNVTEEDLQTISDGRIFTAKQAQEVNLIDSTGYMDDAISKTIEQTTDLTSDYSVVTYEELFTFGKLFNGLGSKLSQNTVKDLKSEFYSHNSQVLYLWQ